MPFFAFSQAEADILGDKVLFNTNPKFDDRSRTNVTATLRTLSTYAYFYVDDTYWSGLSDSTKTKLNSDIGALAEVFDNTIYPKSTQFWGSEPIPGVDKDPRITILLEDLTSGSGGYFENGNQYESAAFDKSNQREMVILNIKTIGSGLERSFLAHEFQHLIAFNQKNLVRNVNENVWLNELRSEYNPTQLGFNKPYANSPIEKRVRSFLQNPSDSLTEWPNTSTDYAMVAVFGEYLTEQYTPSILSDTLKYSFTGIESFNRFWQEKAYPERFTDVFLNWMTAVSLNNTSVGSRYGFTDADLKYIHVEPQSRMYVSETNFVPVRVSLKNWQPSWIEFNMTYVPGGKSLKLELFGDAGQNFAAGYIAYYLNGGVQVRKIMYSGGIGSAIISNTADNKLQKVVLVSTNATKTTGFSEQESSYSLEVKTSLTDAVAQNLEDGALIKRPGEDELYVIRGKYKRYLHPSLIAMYGHLNPANAIELDPKTFDSYSSSNYVKYVDDKKVYAVWPDGTKHWLNMTGEYFGQSGRDWDSMFVINELELNWYKTGPDILK